jgi:Glycosyltransferase family 87
LHSAARTHWAFDHFLRIAPPDFAGPAARRPGYARHIAKVSEGIDNRRPAGAGRSLTSRSGLPQGFWALAGLFVVAASAWIAHRSNTRWDYPIDAGPPIDDLAHLRVHDFLAARPDMGPLSILLRAPFAALGQLVGDGGEKNFYLDDFRFGAFPCLVAGGAFGLAMARFVADRGCRPLACAAVIVLATVNPVTLRAIHFGHPEEALGAALLAGAMLAAIARRPWLAAILVALALANKQWAVVGTPAVVIALWAAVGSERLRGPAIALVTISAAFLVPLLVVDADSLVDVIKRMADLRGNFTTQLNIWYPFAPALSPERALVSTEGLRAISDWLAVVARPLIVAVGIIVPLAFARRMRQDVLGRAFPLLALVLLLRCMLDPLSNAYYHLPFFLAVLAADAISGRFYATAAAVVFLQAPVSHPVSPENLNRFYLLWAPAFAVYLAGRTYGLDWVALFRSGVARGRSSRDSRPPPRVLSPHGQDLRGIDDHLGD